MMEMVYGSRPTTPKKILKYVCPFAKLSLHNVYRHHNDVLVGVQQPLHWRPQLQLTRCVK